MKNDERASVLDRFERVRNHSHRMFASVRDDAYYASPISLRHPIVFYEGHLAAFNVITLVRNALGRPGVDEKLEILFARGIDPETADGAKASAPEAWPSRSEVAAYVAEADALVRAALERDKLDDPSNPLLRRAESVYCMLEHEQMHQETFRYMIHRLPLDQKSSPARKPSPVFGPAPVNERIHVPAGGATLGAARGSITYGWDNEFPALRVDVPAFDVDSHPVTNAEFAEFVEAGGYQQPRWWGDSWNWVATEDIAHPQYWEVRDRTWHWRGMHRLVALPEHWPAYVSQAEAAAFAKWRGGRLLTEAEYHRAAFGDPSGEERRFPWGHDDPAPRHGNFDFEFEDPEPVGSRPAGASAWGVHELIGNGWEWTSTLFDGFPGFLPQPSYPPYSSDFFDGRHYVMKGASPATAVDLIRRSFRNWFRPNYPHVYSKFRVVR